MKKIYGLVSLLLMLCFNTVQAQLAWTYEEVNVDEIKGGTEQAYLIRQAYGPHSKSGYLIGYGNVVSSEVVGACGYYFIQDGEKTSADGTVFPVYVFQNVESGLYLSEGNPKYTDVIEDAYHFTARKAVEYPTENDIPGDDWEIYSNGVDARSQPAAENGAWVFCSPASKTYPTHFDNPAFYPYTDINNWFVYEANPRELTSYEKLNYTFNRYYTVPVDEVNYPVGNNPGEISQDIFDFMHTTYVEAEKAVGKPDMDPAELDRIAADVVKSFELYEKNLQPLSAGYYMLVSARQPSLAREDYGRPLFDLDVTPPTTWSIENAGYIWKLTEVSAEEKTFYIQNYLTDYYMGTHKPDGFLVKDGTTPVEWKSPKSHVGGQFYLSYNPGGYVNMNPQFLSLGHWGDLNDIGNRFKWLRVDSAIVKDLSLAVEQQKINNNAEKAVAEIEEDLKALTYLNGFSQNGVYQSNAQGLVTELLGENAHSYTEGAPEYLFDNNMSSYYHTCLDAKIAPEGHHWITVDLGKEVKELYIKFSKRENNQHGNPTKFALYTNEDGIADAPAEAWNLELAKDTVIYEYSTKYGANVVDSSTYVGKIVLSQAAQYIRFEVINTQINQVVNKVSGPAWHLSELRFYDAAECVPNPRLELVPQEVMDNLQRAIDTVKAQLEGDVTKESYEALLKAIDEFWENYPDPTGLEDKLESARQMAEIADETAQEYGYFKEGAKAGLQAEIDAISVELKSKEHNVEELQVLDDRLTAAIQKFNSMLIVPTPGVYRIINNGAVETATDQFNAYICSKNADIDGAVAWDYKDDSDLASRWNTLWSLEKNEVGQYAFKNLANGLYIKNIFEGLTKEQCDSIGVFNLLTYKETPSYFNLVPGSAAGSMLIQMYNSHSINTAFSNGSHALVNWADSEDPNNQFTFQPVTEEDFSESYMVDVLPNTAQVVCLPIALTAVYTSDGSAYKVLGRKGNEIHLEMYEDGELIPAGTPFIVVTGEMETMVETVPEVTMLSELLEVEYERGKVEQNGLVSAPRTVCPGIGYGILDNTVVKVTTRETQKVQAGTGFFNSSIPETASSGFVLTIEGDLNGEGTGITANVVKKNSSVDVYTVTGVKVYDHVKKADVLNKLQKGIYIIGNEKVIVK